MATCDPRLAYSGRWGSFYSLNVLANLSAIPSKSCLRPWMKLNIIAGLQIFHCLIIVALHETAKWQRVKQPVKPVVSPVVDVRVLTDELTQQARVLVDIVEVLHAVQRQQNDQSLFAFRRHVVVESELELRHTVSTEENNEKRICP